MKAIDAPLIESDWNSESLPEMERLGDTEGTLGSPICQLYTLCNRLIMQIFRKAAEVISDRIWWTE